MTALVLFGLLAAPPPPDVTKEPMGLTLTLYQPHTEPEGGHAPGLRLHHQLALELRVPPEPYARGEHDVIPGGQLLGTVGLDGLRARYRSGQSRR